MEAIISLNDATVIGLKVTRLTFMAIKADPQIALRIINSIKLFVKNLFSRNLSFTFGLWYIYSFKRLHIIISLTIPQIISIIKLSYHSI